MDKRIGAQLYTLREKFETPEQINAALKAVKEMGYDSVQLYGGGLDLIKQLAYGAKLAGLKIVGVLITIKSCECFDEELFSLCREYGIPDIGISGSYADCKEYEPYIQRVNLYAARARKEGFSFSYHNHSHEFITLEDGFTGMHHFIEGFSHDVDFMPDTYWLQDGGKDIRLFIEQLKGRIKILHLKDMKRTEQGNTFAEVGSGNLSFKEIIKTACEIGVEEFVVEQDRCDFDSLLSLQKSLSYIKTVL